MSNSKRKLSKQELSAAASRCLHDLGYARCYITAINAIAEEINRTPYYLSESDFIVLTKNAMRADLMTRCLRVLGSGEQAGLEGVMTSFQDAYGASLPTIHAVDSIRPKLKRIRDKTHFHLDAGYTDADRAWTEAGLTGAEVVNAIDTAITVLNYIQTAVGGADPVAWQFDAHQVRPVVDLCRQLAR